MRPSSTIAELRECLLQVSFTAWTGVQLVTVASCALGEQNGQDVLLGPADASTEHPWTRCPATEMVPDERLHAAALAALVPVSPNAPGPCAFGGCHDKGAAKAKLELSLGTADLRALLVEVPACEVPSLPLVDARGGEDALARSWLWQKLTAPAALDGALLGQAAWGEAASCAAQAGGATPYGARMPVGIGPALLSDERLRAVQRWICGGAPDARGLP